MARRRFFVPHVRQGTAELTGDDAEHLTRVLRVEAGEQYEISDNERVYLADVETARKSLVLFRITAELPAPVPTVQVTVAAALIKFDHWEWMLEKATELGVTRIVPVRATRSEKGLEVAAAKRLARWRRILQEASQQSRRARLPEIDEAVRFEQALALPGQFRLRLEEQGSAAPILSVLPPALERNAEQSVLLLVGPEGGWTDPERAAADTAGWQPVSLGPQILRAETAPIAALAILQAAWAGV